MGAEGPAGKRPAADHRGLPQVPLNPVLSVVVACFNEERNLPRFPRELFAALDALDVSWEVVLIDDGSTDGTAAAADALAAERADVRVLRLPRRRGLGGALRAGFSEARGEWIAALDADLSFRPEALRGMLDAARASRADMVGGSPFLRAGDLNAVPWARRLPSLLLNAFYRGLFDLKLTAYTSMFRLYRAEKLRALDLKSEGFEISAEIAARAAREGWTTVEVAVALGARTAGVSKLRRGRELARHLMLIARLLFTLAALAAAPASARAAMDATAYVDPLIGTDSSPTFDAAKSVHGGAGNVYPGATVPFGMVQFGPDTDHPGRFGYAYGDHAVQGFSLTHLSGAGCLVSRELPGYPMISLTGDGPIPFSHKREKAEPGFYAVRLDNGVDAALSATERSGFARLRFPKGATPALTVRTSTAPGGAQPGELHVLDARRVGGWVRGGNFCDLGNTFTVYYAFEFDTAASSAAADTGITLTFAHARRRTVRVKAAISYVSEQNAWRNLAAESPGWSLAAVRRAARARWRSALDAISVRAGAPAQKTIFYTALYHSLLHPNIFSDVDGRYAGFDRKIRALTPPTRIHYADYSGWDIYRTQIPLVAALFPARASDMMRSLLADAEQCGGLPRWPYNNDEAGIMVGAPAAIILADAYSFGARDFDAREALSWMTRGGDDPAQACNGRATRPGLAQFLKLGYVPEGAKGVWGSASTTLEYAAADFAASRLALALGDAATARRLRARADSWTVLLDTATGYIRPLDAAGRRSAAFDPASGFGFVEGNAAQYTWMVPFDFPELIRRLGGPAAVNARLDAFFSRLNAGDNSPYFWIGNEPGFATPWLYNWTGAPSRAADVIRRTRQETFTTGPGGLPGNDDLGALSAWYVWAALGLYPAAPGTADFSVHPPLFSQTRVNLGGAAPLRIRVHKKSPRSAYIERLTLDGVPVRAPSLTLADLRRARELTFVLSDRPTDWSVDARP